MSTVASTPTPAALPHVEAGRAGPTHASAEAEHPAYRYAGDGRFLPANAAAHAECAAWNAWAATINARAASRRSQ